MKYEKDSGFCAGVDAGVVQGIADDGVFGSEQSFEESAVIERRKPVMPIKLPKMLLKKIVPIKGVQYRLCSTIVSATMP